MKIRAERLRQQDIGKPRYGLSRQLKLHCASRGARVTSADGGFQIESLPRAHSLSFRDKLKCLAKENKDKHIYAFKISDDASMGACCADCCISL